MLTIWSWIPFFVPLITIQAIVLAIPDKRLPEDDFENWDNGLSW